MKLYRPVGQKELDLIEISGFKVFPPRLDWQPIFYPVLNKEYAEQIASEWNTKDKVSGYVGYVLEFEIEDEYLSQFNIQTVGSQMPENGVIFSDGIEQDFLQFNSGIEARISVAPKRGFLVV